MPRTRPKNIRVFGGLRFRLFDFETHKSSANSSSDKLRNKGYLVRIVPLDVGYGIYTRRK